MGLWMFAAGVWTSRYGDRELWRRAADVDKSSELWRCAGPMEIWSSGGTLQACRRRDVDVCLLLLEFLAFVLQGSLLPGGLRHRPLRWQHVEELGCTH